MTGDALLVYAVHKRLPGLSALFQPIPLGGIKETIRTIKAIVHMPQLGSWGEETACPTIEQCVRVLEFVCAELS